MNRIEAQKWEAAIGAAHAASSLPADDPDRIAPRSAARPVGIGRLRAVLREWREGARSRAALAHVPARDLLDAGLSVEAVEHELAQPFWRPLSAERK